MFTPNFACRFEKLGPGGRKCSCCNEFHGKTKSKLTRLVRRRLKKFFTAEINREMSE
jgi:hypothetical protein